MKTASVVVFLLGLAAFSMLASCTKRSSDSGSAQTPGRAPGASARPDLSSTLIAFVSRDVGNNSQIYVMNSDGSNQTRLTNNAAWDYEPCWSPDGSKIAFISPREENCDIYVMNPDGTGRARLTDNRHRDYFPHWSPDGTKIAYVRLQNENIEVYVMDSDGSNQTRLTNNPAWDHLPCWSPDGRKIAFVSDRDGNKQIYVMNSDGTNQANLTRDQADYFGPSWSPDGSKIAFWSSPYELVFIMSPDGSDRRSVITPGGSGGCGRLLWSPDGINIVILWLPAASFGPADIYLAKADGTRLTRVTTDADQIAEATWSPDGTKIAFTSRRDGNGNREIYVVDSDGTNQVNLTNNPGDDSSPSWSPFGAAAPQPRTGAYGSKRGDRG